MFQKIKDKPPIVVGGRYYTLNGGDIFTIISAIKEGEPHYAEGFRFKGRSDRNKAELHSVVRHQTFREDGRCVEKAEWVSTPDDLVRTAWPMFTSADFGLKVTFGAMGGVLEGDVVIEGLFKGWKLTNAYPISIDLLTAITNSPKFPERQLTPGDLRVLSFELDPAGKAFSIVGLVETDGIDTQYGVYRIVTLQHPEWVPD